MLAVAAQRSAVPARQCHRRTGQQTRCSLPSDAAAARSNAAGSSARRAEEPHAAASRRGLLLAGLVSPLLAQLPARADDELAAAQVGRAASLQAHLRLHLLCHTQTAVVGAPPSLPPAQSAT